MLILIRTGSTTITYYLASYNCFSHQTHALAVSEMKGLLTQTFVPMSDQCRMALRHTSVKSHGHGNQSLQSSSLTLRLKYETRTRDTHE